MILYVGCLAGVNSNILRVILGTHEGVDGSVGAEHAIVSLRDMVEYETAVLIGCRIDGALEKAFFFRHDTKVDSETIFWDSVHSECSLHFA